MNIILSNSTTISGNRGCVALSISTMFLLDEILSKKGISYTFYLPQSGQPVFGEYSIRLNDRNIKYTACSDPSIYNTKQLIKNIIKFKDYKVAHKIFKNADYILDIGQGDSFSDIYGKARFYWIFSQYKLSQKFHIPLCILPQTIGPFKDKTIKEQATKGIQKASLVMTRDRQSYDYVKELLPNKEVSEFIDVAFFMPYKKKHFDSQLIHVGLNISSLLWNGGYTRNNQFNLKADYQELIHKLIKYFLSLQNVKLHLIPHVVTGERNIENDYEISFEIYEKYNHPNLILSEFFLGPIEAKNYIAGMDFFMGARMHSTIAAFSSGVPVVPMAYSRKFNGLFADTLSYSYLADMKKDNNTIILQLIKESFTNRQALKAEIEQQQQTTIKECKEKLQKTLSKFLNLE